MLGVIGRLKGGTELAQARADLAIIGRNLAQQYPDQNQQIQVNVEPLLDRVVGNVRRFGFFSGQSLWYFSLCVQILPTSCSHDQRFVRKSSRCAYPSARAGYGCFANS